MTEFKFTQDYAVYKFKQQSAYPIQESDWNRLKRQIKDITPHTRIYQILSSVFFGIFASAIFALIAFQTAKDLSTWVVPTTWAILCLSLFLGIVLLILDGQQKQIISVSISVVLNEMDLIEQGYDRPDGSATNNEPPRTTNLIVGTWRNEWTVNNETYSEICTITQDRKYLIDGQHIFNVQDVIYDEETRGMTFVKAAVKSDDDRKLTNLLQVASDRLLVGTEVDAMGSCSIKYTKIAD
jgi:hypothetical protein